MIHTSADPGDDAASVDVAYERLYRPLIGLATLLTGSRSAAEEVVHDVFAAAIPRWDTIERPDQYLNRAVVNRVHSLGRRVTRSRSLPHRPERVTGEPELDESWQYLRHLPYKQRAALVLRIHVDMVDSEIARHLNCNEATVRSLVFRGLASIRKDMT